VLQETLPGISERGPQLCWQASPHGATDTRAPSAPPRNLRPARGRAQILVTATAGQGRRRQPRQTVTGPIPPPGFNFSLCFWGVTLLNTSIWTEIERGNTSDSVKSRAGREVDYARLLEKKSDSRLSLATPAFPSAYSATLPLTDFFPASSAFRFITCLCQWILPVSQRHCSSAVLPKWSQFSLFRLEQNSFVYGWLNYQVGLVFLTTDSLLNLEYLLFNTTHVFA